MDPQSDHSASAVEPTRRLSYSGTMGLGMGINEALSVLRGLAYDAPSRHLWETMVNLIERATPQARETIAETAAEYIERWPLRVLDPSQPEGSRPPTAFERARFYLKDLDVRCAPPNWHDVVLQNPDDPRLLLVHRMSLNKRQLSARSGQAIAACNRLRHLSRLDLSGGAPAADFLSAVLGEDGPPALTQLCMNSCSLNSASVAAWKAIPPQRSLTHLSMRAQRTLPLAMEALRAPALRSLTHFAVSPINVSELTTSELPLTLVRHLSAAPLKHLGVHFFPFGDAGLMTLAQSAGMRSLRHIGVRQAALRGETLGSEVMALAWPELTHLDLCNNEELEDAALARWLSQPRALRVLKLGATMAGDGVAFELAQREHFAGLHHLDLRASQLSDRGVRALLAAPHMAELRELKLANSAFIGDGVAFALAQAEHLNNLEELDLWGVSIGDKALMALAHAPHLASLRRISLPSRAMTPGLLKAFEGSPYLRPEAYALLKARHQARR